MDPDTGKLRVTWSEAMKRALINGLSREAAKVQCVDGRFKKASWQRILDGFIKETGLVLNKQQLHNQYGDLKKKYVVFKRLTLDDNFTVDPVTNNVTASADVWAAYIEENPLAKEFQYKPLNYYEELNNIFSGCVGACADDDYDEQDRVMFENSAVNESLDSVSDAKGRHSRSSHDVVTLSNKKRTRADEDVAPILLSVGGDLNSKVSKTAGGDRSRYVALFSAKHAGAFTAEERVKIKRILTTNQDVCVQYEHTEEDEIEIFFRLILKEYC
jgi:hypothetical protein